jgi:hypothetical protein
MGRLSPAGRDAWGVLQGFIRSCKRVRTMMRLPRNGLTLVAVLAAFVATWGCGGNADTAPSGTSPQNGFGQGGPPGGPGGRGRSPIGQLMNKLDKGPSSLNAIANGLRANPPAWDTIQALTAEYAQAAGELGKSDPPKGSKESWAKLTAAFAASATALDKATQAKDLAAAQGAETKIRGSCMECHQTHRGGPGGGFGPRGGRGGPPGGPGGGRQGGSPPGGG